MTRLVDQRDARSPRCRLADQRGTGGSNGLHCRFYGPPDAPQSYFDAFLPIDKVPGVPHVSWNRDADLAQYTTSASVDDLEAIRVALGYPRLNLVGGSYGTRLAMEYVGGTRHGCGPSSSSAR